MSFIDRLFGQTRKKVGIGLADPSHVARQWIDEASNIADHIIGFSVFGSGTIREVNSVDAMRLVAAIEKAIEKSPDDLDLLVAKSGALCHALQFKTAEETIDHVLTVDPEHFEARMRKNNWSKWEHVFAYPSWSEKATLLHPLMAAHLQQTHSVQIVRDGLQMGIAVVREVPPQEFPMGLSPRMRSKWEAVWSDTPHVAVVAHYLMIEDDPANPWKAEGFLQTFVPEETIPEAGYWLLQRLSNLASIFIIIVEGPKVLFNKRYVFPEELRATLQSISQKAAQKSARKNVTAFQNAMQWHMQHFDMRRLHF